MPPKEMTQPPRRPHPAPAPASGVVTPPRVWKAQSAIITASIVAVTVFGTMYGAGLAGSREQKKQKPQYDEGAAVKERIAHLQRRRDLLMNERIGLVAKIERFRDKVKDKADQECKKTNSS